MADSNEHKTSVDFESKFIRISDCFSNQLATSNLLYELLAEYKHKFAVISNDVIRLQNDCEYYRERLNKSLNEIREMGDKIDEENEGLQTIIKQKNEYIKELIESNEHLKSMIDLKGPNGT